MTVATTTNRKAYAGNGVTTSFDTTPVAFFNSTDLQVTVVVDATGVETLLTNGVQYSVSGGSGAVGTVNTAGGSAPLGAVPSLSTLIIVRSVPYTQPVDFVNNDSSDADVAEGALDRLTFLSQQLFDGRSRCLQQPAGDTATISALPAAVARALLFLAFDSNGNPIASAGPQTGTPASSFMATVLAAATAVAARQLLILDKHGADIASSATVNLDNATGDYVFVTGVVTITAITLAEGVEKTVKFSGSLTLTNGASLILPAAANIVTIAGDTAVFRGEAAGVVRCVGYSHNSVNFVTASLAQGGQISLSSGVTANITSITLPAGDWDVDGVLHFNYGATDAISQLIGSTSVTSATHGAVDTQAVRVFPTAGQVQSNQQPHRMPVPINRMQLTAASTTVFLVASATFTGAYAAHGMIRARRFPTA